MTQDPISNNKSSNMTGRYLNPHRHNKERSKSFDHQTLLRNRSQSIDKASLWKGALVKELDNNVVVQMVGMDSPNHTVYARVDPNCAATAECLKSVPLGKVIEVMVDEGWRHAVKDILEKGVHVENETYPSANELLKLGSVWLVNETGYCTDHNAKARRLSESDEMDTPDWKDMTLRVHYVPERFFVAYEIDWSKYCKGLLLDGCTSAYIGGVKQHVPMTGLPDKKDGALVYENDEIGFALLNKPGGMPTNSTKTNHAEDVASMYGAALKERHGEKSTKHISIPLRAETEMNGLLLVSTKREFCSYMHEQLDAARGNDLVAENCGVAKTYKCLVCIKHPSDIDRIEKLMNRDLTHWVNVKSACPKTFTRTKPTNPKLGDWQKCVMRITSIGDEKFRAACVSSKYNDSNDYTLAHRLWDPRMEMPAEELGVSYVMQVDVQLLTTKPHQIRGQLAALGCPIVGDVAYGGGSCVMRMHHHMWQRMAVQLCHLEFNMPEWNEDKTALVPTDKKCAFHLNTAWWTEYLNDYERSV